MEFIAYSIKWKWIVMISHYSSREWIFKLNRTKLESYLRNNLFNDNKIDEKFFSNSKNAAILIEYIEQYVKYWSLWLQGKTFSILKYDFDLSQVKISLFMFIPTQYFPAVYRKSIFCSKVFDFSPNKKKSSISYAHEKKELFEFYSKHFGRLSRRIISTFCAFLFLFADI